MKKLFLLFAACLACTLSTFAYDFEVDGIYYNLLGGDSVAVTSSSNEYSGSVTIPETVDYNSTTYRVTTIGNFAFQYCSSLTEVTIPNSVTTIGSYAFYQCSNLTEITLPNSVTTIGNDAFRYCSRLTEVTLPNSVTTIVDGTFRYCSRLTEVTLPNSVTTIGNYAFDGCSSLTSVNYTGDIASWCAIDFGDNPLHRGADFYLNDVKVTDLVIPDGITTISDWFRSCTNIQTVTLPNSVTTIGDLAFYGCSSLTAITWNAKNCTSAPFSNIASQITSFTFGEEVASIPASLCKNMSQLTAITIPNSVTTIGNSAFDGCSSLTAITWNAKKCTSSAPFSNVASQITSFTFGEEVASIPASLCKNMSQLTAITIPNSVTTIGYEAFYDCSSLTSITIPNSVTTIVEGTFRYCSRLTEVTIPNSVTTIGGYAFYQCSNLTEITLPNSVTTIIGGSAFFECSSLEAITVETGNPTYHSTGNCLIHTDDKTLVVGCKNSIIPTDGSVTTIGHEAFSRCSSLTAITLPNSVTTIGDNAFWGCRSLTYITSRAATPPTTASNAFEYVPTGAEVTVPCGAAPSYRVATGWTGFQYVNEDFIYDFNVTTSDEDAGLVQIIQEPSCSQAAIIKALPMDGYVFKAWSDGNTRSMRQITVDEDINLVAYFIAIDGSDNTENTGGITVDPADNSVTFTWPSVGGAVTYVFDIYADAAQTDRICTLTCNAIGQLINISFPRNKPAAIQEGTLLNFTIDGLDESTTYSYTLKTYDADDTLIASHTGIFKTTGETTAVETPYIASPDGVRKVIENGTIYIVRDGEKYTIDGRKM